MPIDLLNINDPLLAGVDPTHLQAFDVAKASSHLSRWKLQRYSQAQIFVADCLVKLWGKQMGGAHLLTDARIDAIAKALAEFTPKQIADAIRAYAKHCREDKERQSKPWMRKTFEKLFADGLETWVAVGGQAAAGNTQDDRKIADLRDHQEFMREWSQIPAERQTDLLRRAGQRRPSLSPMLSNPLFRAELRKLMEPSGSLSNCCTGVSPVEPAAGVAPCVSPVESSPAPADDLVTVEQLHADFQALGYRDRQLLIQKARKQLEARGYFPGHVNDMNNPKIRTRVYLLLQRQRKSSQLSAVSSQPERKTACE